MRRFLDIDCPMARAIRAHDWSDNPLGPPDHWPNTLKTTVSLVLGSRFPQCIAWGENLISIPNDAFVPILGNKQDWLGKPLGEVWNEVWDDVRPFAERALAGEASYLEDLCLTVDRDSEPEEAWFTFCYSPIRDEWGQVVGMLDTVVETTSKVRTQQYLEIANGELTHRIKNTLAVFQAIVHQSFKGEPISPEARERFEARLSALARAHDLISRSERREATIAEILQDALTPHLPHADAADCEGPDVTLTGQQVLSLGLAVHELATNAAKFGALSTSQGKIAVSWRAGKPNSDDPFEFDWTETGGPAVSEPGRKGFGTRLITRVLASDFRGDASLDYRPGGVRFGLRTTMRNLKRGD